ncbi:hypothetical protein ANO11243_061150 [Dothideomycetidae sp. 11243]|nr:hypothetical protein ANO11243_061150 [fungal sp. No.11243]
MALLRRNPEFENDRKPMRKGDCGIDAWFSGVRVVFKIARSDTSQGADRGRTDARPLRSRRGAFFKAINLADNGL